MTDIDTELRLQALEEFMRRFETLPKSTAFGTYTPTFTHTTNIAATTAAVCQYSRVGSVVTVSGRFNCDPTAAGGTASVLGISLPIASNLTGGSDLGGTAINGLNANQTAAIDADGTNDRAQMRWLSNDLSNKTWSFVFAYLIT